MIIKTEQLLYNHSTFKKPSLTPEPFSMHCHNTYELIFFEKGEANYIIDEKKYKLHKNDLIFIRPYKYHYIEFTKDTEYSRINIAFSESLVKESVLKSIPKELEIISCPSDSVTGEIFAHIEYYSKKLPEDMFIDILSAMITEIIHNLRLTDIDMVYIPSTISPLLTEVLEYINKNLFTIKEIKELGNLFNISEQYLFRLFQTQLHISPHKYLTIKRLLYAQTMLQQGKRPTEIYYACGFDSYVSFYKQYVKMFGHPPSKESKP